MAMKQDDQDEDDVEEENTSNQTRTGHDEQTFCSLNDQAIEAFRPSLENAAAVLCNLAGVDHLKRSVLHEAILPSLVNTVLRDVATRTLSQMLVDHIDNVPYNSLLFRNTAAIVRNVSSIENIEYREQLRKCPSLLWSLITVVRAAVRQQCTDLKSVEHCLCSMRNLSHAIQSSPPNGHTEVSKMDAHSPDRKSTMPRFRLRSSSLRSKRAGTDQDTSVNGSISFPPDSPLNLLYHIETIQVLLAVLQQSSNPCALEAAAGCLQNMTTGKWEPSKMVKRTLRTIHGLPILTEILNTPAKRVTVVAASTLRNAATEDQCCLLLGKHALPMIISALSSCINVVNSMEQPQSNGDSEWQLPNASYQTGLPIRSTIYGTLEEPISEKSAHSAIAALLQLCSVLIHRRIEHARRFVTLGGIEKCQEIYTSIKSVTVDNSSLQKSKEWVHQLAQQLLLIMWNFNELRPIYKLAGWTESDFGIAKRNNRLSSLVRRKSTKTNLPDTLNGQSHEVLRRTDSLCLTQSAVSQGAGWPPRARNNVPLYVRDSRTHRLNLARSTPMNRVRSYRDSPYVQSQRTPNNSTSEALTSDDSTLSNARWADSLPPTAVHVPSRRAQQDSSTLNYPDSILRKPEFNTANHPPWIENGFTKPEDLRTANGADIPDSWV